MLGKDSRVLLAAPRAGARGHRTARSPGGRGIVSGLSSMIQPSSGGPPASGCRAPRAATGADHRARPRLRIPELRSSVIMSARSSASTPQTDGEAPAASRTRQKLEIVQQRQPWQDRTDCDPPSCACQAFLEGAREQARPDRSAFMRARTAFDAFQMGIAMASARSPRDRPLKRGRQRQSSAIRCSADDAGPPDRTKRQPSAGSPR